HGGDEEHPGGMLEVRGGEVEAVVGDGFDAEHGVDHRAEPEEQVQHREEGRDDEHAPAEVLADLGFHSMSPSSAITVRATFTLSRICTRIRTSAGKKMSTREPNLIM